jgi:hypothetical protein
VAALCVCPNAFINSLQSSINSRKISAQTGDTLIAAAQAIIAALVTQRVLSQHHWNGRIATTIPSSDAGQPQGYMSALMAATSNPDGGTSVRLILVGAYSAPGERHLSMSQTLSRKRLFRAPLRSQRVCAATTVMCTEMLYDPPFACQIQCAGHLSGRVALENLFMVRRKTWRRGTTAQLST